MSTYTLVIESRSGEPLDLSDLAEAIETACPEVSVAASAPGDHLMAEDLVRDSHHALTRAARLLKPLAGETP